MTNDHEEQKKSSAIKQEPNHDMEQISTTAINNNTSTPKNKPVIAIGAVLIAIGALGSSLYTLKLNHQVQNQLANNHRQLTEHIGTLEQNQNKAQELIEMKTNKLEETRAVLQNELDELNKQLQSAMSQRFYQNQNWILLKARYYLELAQINAHWSKSFDATTTLLEQSDQLLQQIKDPKIFEIRQAIAKDITTLQTTPKIDTAGILSQLDAAQNSIDTLSVTSTLDNNKLAPATTDTPETTAGKTSIWRLHLQDSMKLLSKLVVIRRNDEDIKPLISPAYEAILKESIRLSLQEAQWAVLNNNAKVYQLVLTQTIAMLKKNFNENAPETVALIKKLSELQQIQLVAQEPEVGLTALPLLNQLISDKEPAAATNPADNHDGHGGTAQ